MKEFENVSLGSIVSACLTLFLPMDYTDDSIAASYMVLINKRAVGATGKKCSVSKLLV